ncbi:olfactory receptor 6B1-like [Patagioenas fasciata]|uniref:olfactory receptor 6B1-like n=1 Tax=Patagioenas fasciata TaxID=372321 RepID=UPI003A98F6A7
MWDGRVVFSGKSLYLIFLATYMVTITENAVIIFVVKRNRHLQKPMYYFLGNLSFLEICYVSVTLPRLLLGFCSQSMTISFSSCMTQLYFFISLMCTECVVLAAMAWDRYLAVCHPLRYPAIMTHKLCLQLLILSWAGGFSISLVKVSLISQLTFCGPHVMNHFFCDISPVLSLSCTDVSLKAYACIPYHSLGQTDWIYNATYHNVKGIRCHLRYAGIFQSSICHIRRV